MFSSYGKEIPPNPCDSYTDNILSQQIKMPLQWSKEPASKILESRMTKRKLELQRKQANMPHSSFDLDGDGHVSVKDLFLS
jgi:hypothetical protein